MVVALLPVVYQSTGRGGFTTEVVADVRKSYWRRSRRRASGEVIMVPALGLDMYSSVNM